ncbi:MAG: hypothetical protein JXQ90_03700 [Cyclobacteriaceae bacterium]
MKKICLIFLIGALSTMSYAQIRGMSVSGVYSKTKTGKTSLFGADSYEYKKVSPNVFMVLEIVQNQGQYVYWKMDPIQMAHWLVWSGKPPFVISPSVVNGPLRAVDYTPMQLDWEMPILFRRSDFNIDLGLQMLWKVEGMTLSNSRYPTARVNKDLNSYSNYEFGAGRFFTKSRFGIGPIIAAKYVHPDDDFAIRAAAGSALYGFKEETYNFTELGGFLKITDRIYVTVKMRNFTKLFSHDPSEFTEEFAALLTEQLGEQLKVKTNEYTVGLIIDGNFTWMAKLFGAYEKY